MSLREIETLVLLLCTAALSSCASTIRSTTAAEFQTDLKTLIPEIGRLYFTGNSLEVYQNYISPGDIDPKIVRQLQEENDIEVMSSKGDSKFAEQPRQLRERWMHAWKALETQIPTLSATGDQATYQFHFDNGDGSNSTYPAVFIKLNGKWYLKDTPWGESEPATSD